MLKMHIGLSKTKICDYIFLFYFLIRAKKNNSIFSNTWDVR